jgi:hypothetical protein
MDDSARHNMKKIAGVFEGGGTVAGRWKEGL